jgi:hypothetical protein
VSSEFVLDIIHRAMRRMTGLKIVSDLHERPTFPGIYPPLDPLLRRRLDRIRDAGVLFIHIPKNAGMSVSSTLYHDQVFHPTIRYYARVAPDIVRTLPSFAVWRHPVERFVSAFRYAQAGGSHEVPVARAFRDRYMAFQTLDDAIDHVAMTGSLYDLDHIFRPQFWYVADMAGRIAVDRICMIDDLDNALAGYAKAPLEKIAWLNRSRALDIELTERQLARLRSLYPIDFAIHDALANDSLSVATRAGHSAYPDQSDVRPSAVSRR